MTSTLAPASSWTVQYSYRRQDQMLGLRLMPKDSPDGSVVDLLIELPKLLQMCGVTAGEIAVALPDGEPPPVAENVLKLAAIRNAAIPADLTGKSVLDIGGYDGETAAVCLERGTTRVRVIDNGQWQNYHWRRPMPLPGVEFIGCDVLAWQEPADVVLFGNVLYHVHDPWRTLWHLKNLTRQQLVLWTSFIEGDQPVWRLYAPEDEGQAVLDNVFTVFWKPTVTGLLRLLRLTGWRNVVEQARDGDHIVFTAEPT